MRLNSGMRTTLKGRLDQEGKKIVSPEASPGKPLMVVVRPRVLLTKDQAVGMGSVECFAPSSSGLVLRMGLLSE